MIRLLAFICLIGTSVVAENDDQMLGFHAIAMALTMQDTVSWRAGTVTIINNGGRCVDFENTITINGTTHREVMNACKGGGNDNTWIINKQWIVSSVDRSHGGDCRTRFATIRLSRTRIRSEAVVCQNSHDSSWVIIN